MKYFKNNNIKDLNYTDFENMVEDHDTNRVLPFNITNHHKCNIKKCNIFRNCSKKWICQKLDTIVDSLLIITIHIFYINI